MTEPDVQITPMTAAHLDAVIALDRRLTGQSRKGFFSRRLDDSQAEGGATVALVAVRGETPVGYLLARVQDGEFGDVRASAVIDAVGLEPASRGQGVAGALMTELETRARALGVTEIRSEADWSETDLIRFFAARGFELAPDQVLERPVTPDLETVQP